MDGETYGLCCREGKLDVLRDLCDEHKDGDYINRALKSKDKFGQTPMLSSISASENRNEILKFLLKLILERSSDTELQEVSGEQCSAVQCSAVQCSAQSA
jgi:hypothetical protein